MFRSAVLFCTLGVVLAGGDIDKFMKYAQIKVIKGCFGEEPVMKFFTDMKAACMACREQDASYSDKVDLTSYINQIRYQNRGGNQNLIPVYYVPQNQNPMQYSGNQQPQPYFQQFQQQPQFRGNGFASQNYQPQPQPFQPQQPQYQPFQQPFQMYPRLQKRSTEVKSFDVMEEKVRAKISNITCVMRAMNFIDSDNQPNWTYAKEYIEALPVSEELKKDLMEDHECCKDFSMCVPVHKMKSPLAKELGYPLAYHKCMHMKKMRTCMKHDFNKFSQTMGFEDTMSTHSQDILMSMDDDHNAEGMINNVFKLFAGSIFDM